MRRRPAYSRQHAPLAFAGDSAARDGTPVPGCQRRRLLLTRAAGAPNTHQHSLSSPTAGHAASHSLCTEDGRVAAHRPASSKINHRRDRRDPTEARRLPRPVTARDKRGIDRQAVRARRARERTRAHPRLLKRRRHGVHESSWTVVSSFARYPFRPPPMGEGCRCWFCFAAGGGVAVWLGVGRDGARWDG